VVEIESFRFSNDLFYEEETTLTFRPGITLLRGINYDAGVTEDNSNGTGKTRLVQLLSGFIFNDSDRGGLKKLVTPEFKGCLNFHRLDEKWEFHADVKENVWDILKNGQKHIEHHKFSECQKLLANEINLTRKDWTNFVHINRHSISVLLQGSPDEKRKFLENFFNIDDFYKEKLAEYKSIKEAKEKEIGELEQNRARYGQVLEALKELDGREYLKIQLESAKSFFTHLKSQHANLTTLEFKLKTDIGSWKDYYEFIQKAEGRPALSTLKDKLQSLQSSLAEVKQREQCQQTVSIKAKSLISTIEEPLPPENEEPSNDYTIELESQLLKMQDKQRLINKFKLLKSTLPEVDTALKDGLQVELGELLARQADNKLHLELVKDGNNCSRCGQKMDFVLKDEDPTTRHRALKEESGKIVLRITEIRDILSAISSRTAILEQLNEIKTEAGKYPPFSNTPEEVKNQIEKAKKSRSAWVSYRRLKDEYTARVHAREVVFAEITALGYPDILTENLADKRVQIVQEIGDLQIDLSIVQKANDLLDKVALLDPQASLQGELLGIQEELADINTRIQKLHECFGEYKTQLTLANTLHSQKEELEEKLKDSDNIYNEYRILQALVKFFSPAGFKMYELRKRCELLIEKANFWSPVFFSEKYEWSLPKAIDSLEFMVQPVAHRKKQAPYPASQMSSGEENRGERVLLFSKLSLAPKNKSSNLLFLDEIEGHLDNAGKIVFTEIVIPKLKETFKDRCIVVISHEESLRKSPHVDHLWLAERKNRKTSLKVFENYNKRA
jgi:DNA repair exonuclease SbcCD ATPase subunit